MRPFHIFLILTAVLSIHIFSKDNESLLISIQLDKVKDLNKIEELNLPVFHIYDNILITKVEASKIDDLKSRKVDYSILDQAQHQSDYYLISSKNKLQNNSIPSGINVIYTEEKSTIIKDPVSIEMLRAAGFSPVKIGHDPMPFKNIKMKSGNNLILPDSVINAIISNVSADSVKYFIQSLQNFQTRFLFADTRDAVAEWIKSQFIRFGYTNVVIDSFLYQNTWQKNVIATLEGVTNPERLYVFGGHHDSYSSGNPNVFAPGADDNASGTAAVLEMARVLKQSGYNSNVTIKFITFGAEEYGLWGSRDYADYAVNNNLDIKLMINHDMISHTSSTLFESFVDINHYTGSEGWADIAFKMVETYSDLIPNHGALNSSGSDSHSFWQKGYKAVYFEENDFSPFYHSPQDVITNYSMTYCAEVIKSSGALLLTAPKIPTEIKNYFVYDIGNGTSVKLSWLSNTDSDFKEYKVYIGTNSGFYNKSYSLVDTTFIIDSLSEGTKYFIAVSATDSEGFESFLTERNIIPFAKPLSPAEFTVIPKRQVIELSWNNNKELDLAGYNIYRSESFDGSYIKINSNVLVDSFYSDDTPVAGQYYYYFIKAEDNQFNESTATDTIKSRIISLDKGILVVDETNDGNGTILNPTDEQVDEFYNQLLGSYSKTNYDITSNGAITLPDLGAFSTVIWQAADNVNALDAQSAQQAIKDYLDNGGNFIYDGYRPTRAWQKNTAATAKYKPGMFVYDYLKVDSSANILGSRFIGAHSLYGNYPDIFIDSSKTLSTDNFHLKGVESIFPNGEGTTIYTFETLFDSTSLQGKLKGTPVGIEYKGTDYKSVVLSFPLYYMNFDDAKELIERILSDSFNEVTKVYEEQQEIIPFEYMLYQNYPNPFNPTTKISWQSPVSGRQTVKVFDVLGNEIATLVDEVKDADYHSINFDASDLPSGVYFYQLKINDFIKTNKMLLIK
ncbi:MAG: M20/M25/M40 family metallo-hydrolase [Ignavibacteriaceae bacterium]|nr:M20/M25/M40 family metallo-hydrolase [Ignavibacteriaceae bacterium]